MTAIVAVVGLDLWLIMHVSMSFKTLGGNINTVLMNSSNTELAPAMALPVILAMFPSLASRHDIPAFTVKGLELTISQIEDTSISDTHTHIGGLPRMYPLGYGKASSCHCS